ncbi:MAG: ribonuclease III [Pyrinomonadaceae bacterium]
MDQARLENLLGYQFTDPDLLVRALTHRSWAHEQFPGEAESSARELQNESLEFVGDSVLGLVVAEWLYRRHPGLSEGGLTLMKHRLVSTTMLAEVAEALGIGEFVRLGRGEVKTGGRGKPAILADTVEAIFGAVFFDGGYEAAASCIGRVLADRLEGATPKGSNDFKTMLQEKLQAVKLAAPTYELVRSEGMPHARTFVVEARWDGGSSLGVGRSIKSAEMMAASEALREMETDGET